MNNQLTQRARGWKRPSRHDSCLSAEQKRTSNPLRREKALSYKAYLASVLELCGRHTGVESRLKLAAWLVTETPPSSEGEHRRRDGDQSRGARLWFSVASGVV